MIIMEAMPLPRKGRSRRQLKVTTSEILMLKRLNSRDLKI